MIHAAAFCPQPPVLVPDLAQGAAGELDQLRALTVAAIREACPAGRLPILIGSGPRSRLFAPPLVATLAGFGLPTAVRLGDTSNPATPDTPNREYLPTSLAVGAWSTAQALGHERRAFAVTVGPDFDDGPVAARLATLTADEPVALLVFGDGSARRSTTAPGYFDERAAGFDAAVTQALASGRGAELAALDAQVGAQLWAAGAPVWQAIAPLLDGRDYRARLDYAEAPYGVGYFVAVWRDGSSAGDD